MQDRAPSPVELQRRLVYAVLRPAVRLARRFHLPLKTLQELCRLAYYEELRHSGGLPQARIAHIFAKSLRTVGSLERQLKGDFLAPQRTVEHSRQLEEALTEPMHAEALAERLGEPIEDVQRVLDGLIGAGRLIQHDDGRYSVDHDYRSLVSDALAARLDGLGHQLDVITSTVIERFLGGRRPAMGRTLSFVATDETIEAFAELLVRTVRAQVGDAEEAALKAGGHSLYNITLALAPTLESESE